MVARNPVDGQLPPQFKPSSVINKTPYKAWYGEKPDLSYLRITGCIAYVKRIESKRRKLADEKASPCKLLGYEGNRIYRLLTHDNRVIRSTNVELIEQYTAQPEPSKADDTLDLSRAVSRAKQQVESACSHTPAPWSNTSEERIDDCSVELELPTPKQ